MPSVKYSGQLLYNVGPKYETPLLPIAFLTLGKCSLGRPWQPPTETLSFRYIYFWIGVNERVCGCFGGWGGCQAVHIQTSPHLRLTNVCTAVGGKMVIAREYLCGLNGMWIARMVFYSLNTQTKRVTG